MHEDKTELLTPRQVADMFGVNPKTVTRWANAGKLTPIRTLGGHRRYRASEIRALLAQQSPEGAAGDENDRPSATR
ncbi:MAG TPA: BldC family transcriptional regulator [Nitriliruptorales bacterium]|nr:BldC family transcriptional regulator [Nitriliruptorales bacterium]